MQRALAVVLTVGALFWCAVLFLAPYGLTSDAPGLVAAAASVYTWAGAICHQRSPRSFHLDGVQLPVCARCTGLYVSGAIGALAAWVGRRRLQVPRGTRRLIMLASIPTAASVALEVAGLASPGNAVRAICAVPLGAAAAWVFVRSLRAEAEARTAGRADGMRYDAIGT